MSQTRPDDEPTLVPHPTAQDRSLRALLAVVDDLTVVTEESALLRTTLEHVVLALGLAGGAAYLMTGETEIEGSPSASYGAEPKDTAALPELAHMAIQWQRPIFRELEEGGFVAATPLATKDRELGVMALYGSAGQEAPDRELLRAFGKQIGTGLKNARLYAELRAGADRSNVLHGLTRTLTAHLDLRSGTAAFAAEIRRLMDFDRLIFGFANETGDYLEIYAQPEEAGWGLGAVIPVVGSGPGFCVLNDQPVLERDLLHNHRFIEDMRLLEEGIRSYVMLPLTTRGRSVGVMALGSRREGAYEPASLEVLKPVAGAVALALDNLRLFQRTKELSITDELTPLYNMRYFQQLLDRELKLADRYGAEVSVVFIDLDRFKPVNDLYGHLRGSRVLREVGFLLRTAVRETDYPARYGGDEFVLLLPQTPAAHAVQLAERIRELLEDHVFLQEEGINVRIGASFGCATYPGEAQTKEALIRLADERMYRNKAGRKTGEE